VVLLGDGRICKVVHDTSTLPPGSLGPATPKVMGVLAGNANRYGNLAFQPLLSAPRGIGSGGTPSAFLGALALSAGPQFRPLAAPVLNVPNPAAAKEGNPGMDPSLPILQGSVKLAPSSSEGYGFIESTELKSNFTKDAFLPLKRCPWAWGMQLQKGETVFFQYEVSTKDEPEVIRVSRNDGNNFNNVSPVRQNR
jgi:hypothetical protein